MKCIVSDTPNDLGGIVNMLGVSSLICRSRMLSAQLDGDPSPAGALTRPGSSVRLPCGGATLSGCTPSRVEPRCRGT